MRCDPCVLIDIDQDAIFAATPTKRLLRISVESVYYENTPVKKYWKFRHQKMKIFR